MTTPHHFAYANPLFGGSYRVPPALHDSNFERGQDLWWLEDWIQANPPAAGVERYHAIDTEVPEAAIRFDVRPPTSEVLSRLVQQEEDGPPVELIVARGLGVPAPWQRVVGGSAPGVPAGLVQLLMRQPDQWLSPTLVIYRCGTDGESTAPAALDRTPQNTPAPISTNTNPAAAHLEPDATTLNSDGGSVLSAVTDMLRSTTLMSAIASPEWT